MAALLKAVYLFYLLFLLIVVVQFLVVVLVGGGEPDLEKRSVHVQPRVRFLLGLNNYRCSAFFENSRIHAFRSGPRTESRLSLWPRSV